MSIRYYNGLNGTEAMPLALKAWSDLMETGLSGNYIPDDISTTEALVYSIFDINPVAILIFIEEEDCIYIDAGWVKPEYRGGAYYSMLWNHLIDITKERKKEYICSWILPHNTKMREIAKKQGRTEKLIMDHGRQIIETTFHVK